MIRACVKAFFKDIDPLFYCAVNLIQSVHCSPSLPSLPPLICSSCDRAAMRGFPIHRIARSRSGVVGRVDTMYLSLPRSSLFIPPLPTFRTLSEERGGRSRARPPKGENGAWKTESTIAAVALTRWNTIVRFFRLKPLYCILRNRYRLRNGDAHRT